MSKFWLPFLLLLVTLTGACSTSKSYPPPSATTAIETKKISPASVTPKPADQKSPTTTPYLPTNTTQSTQSPTPIGYDPNVLIQQCFATTPALPESVIPPGILVAYSFEGLSLINFSTHVNKEIPGNIGSVGTSPDGKWLSYVKRTGIIDHFVFESMNGEKPIQIEKKGWSLLGGLLWLDNQRVWFSDFVSDSLIPGVVVLNPFTGQEVAIKTDYPGVKPYQFGTGPGIFAHFGYSSAAYDPSLRWVIYPEFDPNVGYLQTLWDRTSQKKLASVIDGGGYSHQPIWQASRRQFLVVGYPNQIMDYKEWWAVNPDGQITQLTEFGKLRTDYEIYNDAGLSPDGKMLAFGLSTSKDKNGYFLPGSLILLNLATMQAIDTCIPMDSSDPLAWSLDGRYLAVTISTKPDEGILNPLFLVDTKEKQSYPLLEGKYIFPGGWLLQP